MITLVLALALSLVIGCGGEPAETRAPVIGEDQAAPSPTTASPDSTDAAQRFAGRIPDSLRVRRGACPFECCTYREWTAREDLPVYSTERGDGTPRFTIHAGDRFRADSGNVHITGTLVIAVADSVADRPYWAFGPGDTLVVLDYLGEGHFNVWHDGSVIDVAGFWGAESPRLVAESIGQWESEWWVQVTAEDGRTGWIRADAMSVAGADRCA